MVIGKFSSLKMKTVIWWESQLERDYLYLLEIDPDVISYCGQPFRIHYFHNGCEHIYTPDFLVERWQRKEIVEVKPEQAVTFEDNNLLFHSVYPICLQQGYEFLVVTDKTIRMQPQLTNVKLLYKYARSTASVEEQIALRELFISKQEVRLWELEQFALSKGIKKQSIYALLYRGIFTINLQQCIGPNSIVQLTKAISTN